MVTRPWNWHTRRVHKAVTVKGKADCPGCVARRDEIGRFHPGFCGPDCEVKKARDEWIAANR